MALKWHRLVLGTSVVLVLSACQGNVERSQDVRTGDSAVSSDFFEDELPEVVYLASRGTLEEMTEFAEGGGDIEATTAFGLSALMEAAGARNDMLALLLELGGDPDAVDQEGRSALHYAVIARSPEPIRLGSVQLLLDAGADPSQASTAGSWGGRTPCAIAQEQGDEQLVRVLC